MPLSGLHSAHNIGCLAIQVLSCPCGLIYGAFNFGFGIAGSLTNTLLNLAAEISRAAFKSILVHDWPFPARLVYFDSLAVLNASSLRTAAAELPTLSIARSSSCCVTPRCLVQCLT
jgi:hypothetical protein